VALFKQRLVQLEDCTRKSVRSWHPRFGQQPSHLGGRRLPDGAQLIAKVTDKTSKTFMAKAF